MQTRLTYTSLLSRSLTSPQMARQLAAALAHAAEKRHATVRQQLSLLLHSHTLSSPTISATNEYTSPLIAASSSAASAAESSRDVAFAQHISRSTSA